MRKLSRKGRKTPTTTTAVATTSAPESTSLSALGGLELLAAIGQFERHENLSDGRGDLPPRLRFYSEKNTEAPDVTAALGHVVVGTPYLQVDGGIYAAAGYTFITLAEFPSWIAGDPAAKFAPRWAWLEPKPFGAKFRLPNGTESKITETIDTITLILPGTSPLHEDLAPCFPTLTRWAGTKTKAVQKHVNAIEATEKGDSAVEWAKANGPLVNVPPRLRLVSTLRMEAKQGSGFPYALANSTQAPISVPQADALAAWSQDEDAQEYFRGVQERYDAQVAEIQAMAKATA